MNRNKVTVKIGRKYEEAFKSVCQLFEKGCIDTSIVQNCIDDRIIETSQYVFEYTNQMDAIETGTDVGMKPDGSSWFMGFRGAESDSVMGTWHNLIETVSAEYHKEYSLVEYASNHAIYDATKPEEYKASIKKLIELFGYKFVKIEDAAREDSMEDIYIVSLRMELVGGAGEPVPVLCKVLFRYRNNAFFPLKKLEAETIENYIIAMISKTNEAAVNPNTKDNETAIVDNVLNAVEHLINNRMKNSFTESVIIEGDVDTETVSDLVEKGPQDNVCLECKTLKVFGISHVSWLDTAYSVYIGDKKAFLAKVGLNDTLNLYCCCNEADSKLIENSRITCVSPEGNVKEIIINREEDNFGLDDDKIHLIKTESAFARHFFKLECSELARRHVECSRYRCICNTVEFTVNGKPRRKCADCPYPEIMYHYGDGNTAYTPLLSYDAQNMKVVDGNTYTCRFCGRSYVTKEPSANSLCGFCKASLESYEAGQAGFDEVAAYKRYAKMIPLHSRVIATFQKKYCFENEDRLLFIVGKNKYFFDKLSLSDSGLIAKPEKRQ